MQSCAALPLLLDIAKMLERSSSSPAVLKTFLPSFPIFLRHTPL
jgi:hypothetical protein